MKAFVPEVERMVVRSGAASVRLAGIGLKAVGITPGPNSTSQRTHTLGDAVSATRPMKKRTYDIPQIGMVNGLETTIS